MALCPKCCARVIKRRGKRECRRHGPLPLSEGGHPNTGVPIVWRVEAPAPEQQA